MTGAENSRCQNHWGISRHHTKTRPDLLTRRTQRHSQFPTCRADARRPRHRRQPQQCRRRAESFSRVRFWANRTSSRHGLRAEFDPQRPSGGTHATFLSA